MNSYKISKSESCRFNIIKVLMCIFVLIIHAYRNLSVSGTYYYFWKITDIISNIVCVCAVPMFIFISSILLYIKKEQYTTTVIKRTKSLLIPYIIFNFLWIIWNCIRNYISINFHIGSISDINVVNFSLSDWINSFLGFKVPYKPILSLLWYLRDLYILVLLSCLIKKIIDLHPLIMFICILGLWLSGAKYILFMQTFSFVFFCLGYYAVKYNIHLKDFDKNIKLNWTLILWFVMLSFSIFYPFEPIKRLLIIASCCLVIILSSYIYIYI